MFQAPLVHFLPRTPLKGYNFIQRPPSEARLPLSEAKAGWISMSKAHISQGSLGVFYLKQQLGEDHPVAPGILPVRCHCIEAFSYT